MVSKIVFIIAALIAYLIILNIIRAIKKGDTCLNARGRMLLVFIDVLLWAYFIN